jgi:hypothetical protein
MYLSHNYALEDKNYRWTRTSHLLPPMRSDPLAQLIEKSRWIGEKLSGYSRRVNLIDSAPTFSDGSCKTITYYV